MARAMDITSRTLDDILRQVKESLPVGMETLTDSLSVGRTFEVWTLPDLPINGSDMRAAQIVEGSLHHELLANAKPIGFIRYQLSEERAVEGGHTSLQGAPSDASSTRPSTGLTRWCRATIRHAVQLSGASTIGVLVCRIAQSLGGQVIRHHEPLHVSSSETRRLGRSPDFLNGLRRKSLLKVLPRPVVTKQRSPTLTCRVVPWSASIVRRGERWPARTPADRPRRTRRRRIGRAVADPLAGRGDDRLAGAHVEGAALVLDADHAAQDDGDFLEVGSLSRLEPA